MTQVLEKWLDLAETDQDIGEAVATAVCEMMTHVEYGDVIRANVMTRIYTMFEGQFDNCVLDQHLCINQNETLRFCCCQKL